MEIQELKKEAQAHLGLTDEQADSFVEGFLKEAAFNQGGRPPAPEPFSQQNLSQNFADSISKSVGGGLGNLAVNGIVAGVAGLVSSARNAVLYRKFTEALKTVMESNRIVRNADRSKVVSYAETIYKFAPHVASDVNLLSQLLANAIHGEGVDPSTIETITRLEERYSKDMSFKPKNFT